MAHPVNSNAPQGAPVTIGALLRGNELSRLETSLLLAKLLSTTRELVLAHPERQISPEDAIHYASLVGCRLAGIPMAYLTGSREFYGIDLKVSADVLVPRPETELLVDAALSRLGGGATEILDLGTGSGAVAIAIAANRTSALVEAVDVSDSALVIAMANVAAHRLANVDVHRSDWYRDCRHGRYRMIVSNPPYIRDGDPHLDQGDVRHEPRLALTSGTDGLDAIRTIVAGASSRLVDGGHLLFEHGYDQAERCRALMREAGFVVVESLRDLAGIERVCVGTIRR